MKKILFILILLVTYTSFAQTETGGNNEAHLNAFNILAFKWIDVSYERIINDESSAGIAIATKFTSKDAFVFNADSEYAITPFYRYFVAQDNAAGIFGEVFTMFNGGVMRTEIEGLDDHENPEDYTYEDYNDFAFGLGAGYKHVSNAGLVLQGFGGVGRNLSDDKAPILVYRLGVTIGYRF